MNLKKDNGKYRGWRLSNERQQHFHARQSQETRERLQQEDTERHNCQRQLKNISTVKHVQKQIHNSIWSKEHMDHQNSPKRVDSQMQNPRLFG
jgi:hypothetical protein